MEKPQIEIERMMFGDYRIQVWDTNFSSMLDREYFCRGYESAILTAIEIEDSLFKGLSIYYREGDRLTLIKNNE